MSWRVVPGDCIEAMAAMDEASVDAVVTDPPYGLEFMGREWDGADGFRRSLNAADVDRENVFGRASRTGPEYRAGKLFERWCEAWATEALRVLKPGGHLLAFGGTRTFHRLTCGLEDAGFEIRDCLSWLYGSGFPKSLDVAKATDKALGHWRGRAGSVATANGAMAGPNYARTPKGDPVTAAAAAAGWGTALKPAWEPIALARKPFAGTVADNFARHGTGALNVDGCRIPAPDGVPQFEHKGQNSVNCYGNGLHGSKFTGEVDRETGRWPANLVLDPEAAAMLDEQTGELSSGSGPLNRYADKFRTTYGAFAGGDEPVDVLYGDSGGASRFFYVAKPSTTERNAGLDGFEPQFAPTMGNGIGGKEHDPETATGKRNVHPTVKPIDLMRWLCRLVTPPGGTVLDPFAGSGTTGCAVVLEGFQFIGIEREAEYRAIAEARIAWWAEHPEGMELVERLEAEAARKRIADSGQLDLLEGQAA